ncbi:hypothetical protein LSTR_LSTR015245 [Laodelphax striatellus]|uniref:BTB domain-containing protein n=1 Tax=Laodelphax striatellus TaxID=195883 RepID=A0A482XD41_LAOST|nr:hypothetical protein LSTR_LSTR015245 [Laodelphax striatellus]
MSLITPHFEGEKPFDERFKRLFDDDIGNDCEFVVGLQSATIKGHKLIFSSASDVFRAMFYGSFKQEPVRITDLEPDEFKGMKYFIYTGEVIFTSAIETLLIYIAAQKYNIPELCRQCTQYIHTHTSASEVLEFYEYCKTRSISEFDETCCRIIQEKTEDVLKSDYFLHAEKETVDLILGFQSLKLASELDVFDYFEKWATAEAGRSQISAEEMGSCFNSLKKHIRFLSMSWEDFASKPAKSLFLTHDEKYVIGLNIKSFGSAPYPEHLSSLQQPRDLMNFNSVAKKISNTFSVSFGTSDSCSIHTSQFQFTFMKEWFIELFTTAENLCFTVIPKYENSFGCDKLISFRSELKILARNERDNWYIENTSHCAYTSETRNSIKDQFGMLFAVIPLKKLRSKCFSIQNKVNIEGTFILEDIK